MFDKLEESIRQFLSVGLYERPVEWAKNNIDFRGDKGASKRKLDFDYSPFLIDPIAAWDFDGVKKEVTVVAPEQTGKSLCSFVGLLWSFVYKPCISLVVYKSDEQAEKMNKNKLEPLMKNIPSLASELSLPRSHRKDHYNFSNLKSYFMGSGTRISSDSCKVRVVDELDDFIEHEGQVTNLADIRKRGRSFDEAIIYKVCSPKQGGILNKSPIWTEFLNGSQGYWHLKCKGCNELTIRSCDTRHLQFEYEEYQVKVGSCRLVCPKCGHEHIEEDKIWMNQNGAYVHQFPDRIRLNPSFQWGCLASRFEDFDWDKVAQAQLNAGSTGDLEDQVLFDNSYRGLPFKQRRKNGKDETKLRKRCVPKPQETEILYRHLAVDTQDYSFWWRVRAYDKKLNSYGVACGQADTIQEIDKIWEGKFYGGRCEAGIIDVGGHRGTEVANWVKDKPSLLMYKGRGQQVLDPWKLSDNIARLMLVNPNYYKVQLLYKMYDQDFADKLGWYLEPELDEDYLLQMLDHKLDTKNKRSLRPNQDVYDNYVSTGNDHLFDCEKMLMPLNDYYLQKVYGTKKKSSGRKR